MNPLPASTVGAPLVGECVANIECVVEDDALADRYDLWVLRAQAAWVRPGAPAAPELHHRGNGTFTGNGALHDLRRRMTKWRHLT